MNATFYIAYIFDNYVSVFSYPLQANVFHVFTLWGMFLGIAPLLTKAIALSAMMVMNSNATTNFSLVIEKFSFCDSMENI